MKSRVERVSVVQRTPRVLQLEGLFAVAPSAETKLIWEVDLPIETRPWNVGLIVGPSGSGKTSIARDLFGAQMVNGFNWPEDRSILDGFPLQMGVKEVVQLLSSVGFSSPPAWVRPFRVLSNGEQFRVTMARAMAEATELFVVDEFTSVVDRTVAQIGSCAIARTVRERGQKFVAVSCHYDIVEWLQPDWVFEPATKTFQWRELQRRPSLACDIRRVGNSLWGLFRPHHYLSHELHAGATCFGAFVRGAPVAFVAMLAFPHPIRSGWRVHRYVCLPDYQGVGIGSRVCDFVCGVYRGIGKPVFLSSVHPAVIRHCARSANWKMGRAPGRVSGGSKLASESLQKTNSKDRITAGFEYVGPEHGEHLSTFALDKWIRAGESELRLPCSPA